MQRLGEKLRTLRQQRGMTIRDLANKFEISFSHIAILERGESKPSLELLLKIADYFQVTPNQLLLDDIELE